jgi:cell division septal protein FtsQ
LAVVLLYHALLSTNLLSLQRLEIQTQGHLDRRDVLELTGLSPGVSLLALKLKRIREDIENHPWVERARVRRSFPDALRIEIVERKPVARVVLERGALFLDATGALFPPPVGEAQDRWIPLVGLRKSELVHHPGACRRVLQSALNLLRVLPKYPGIRLAKVHLNRYLGVRLILKNGPADIRLGFGKYEERMRRLDRILRHLGQQGRIHETQWVDLRYPRRATVKFQG